MKRLVLILSLLGLFSSVTSYAQDVTTTFYTPKWVESKDFNERAALYQVRLTTYFTYVTIQVQPTKNKKRQNYWTSERTYVVAGKAKLPLLGAEGKDNSYHSCTYNDGWGWNDVTKDKSYYYTLIFSGRIPEGITTFSLVDEATSGRGYGFSNYTINNPKNHSVRDESYCRENADQNNDGICGIYEEISGSNYRLACVKENGNYYLVYLKGGEGSTWWFPGDIKAVLEESATRGAFKASWIMLNKTRDEAYITFDGSVMKSYHPNGSPSESAYMKMYPTAGSGVSSSERSSDWSGTGFALKNGYIVTNFHVVDGAKKIEVHGVNGNASSDYTAEVIATDKNNDLAIIRITDYRFNGFGTIPYAIKSQMVDVGEDVWVLGYPLTQYLGNEIKLTNGVVSSRSGFQGDVATYQITAPVQPGNSGGPLFDSKGNIVGIVNAGVPGAENVGYAIKTSYLKNLADSYSLTSSLPTNNSISSLSLKDQVKSVNNYVFMLICSSKAGSSYSSSSGSSYTSGTSRTGSSGSSSSSSTGSSWSSSSSSSSTSTTSGSNPIMIDLGLSVKWADRNVGANSTTEVGGFYSWGETETKSEFTQENYKWFKDNAYSNPGGLSDISSSSYDPARMTLGGSWRMPTEAELEELISKCKWTWTTQGGVQGYRITGKNGNSIFLPANGNNSQTNTPVGSYWTSDASPYAGYFAYHLDFDNKQHSCSDGAKARWAGVRPVSGSKTLQTSSHKKADEVFADASTKYSNGDYAGSLESVEESIRLMPTGQAHYLRGFLAMGYLKDATIAKSSFRYCIDNGYRPEESQNLLARAYSLDGDHEEAIRQYDEFLKIHTAKDEAYVSALFGKAHCKSELERWSDCISDYKKILEYESIVDYNGYATVYNNIAWAYLNLNQVNKAVEPIKKALKLNHNEAYIWDTDGEVKYKTGNYEDCIVSMSNALAIYKAEGDEEIANSYYYRGLAKIKMGNIAGGYVDLEKASDLGESKAAEELKKINVSDIDFSDNGTFKKTIERDITSTPAGNDSKIVMIEMTEESTVIYMQYTNTKYDTGGWYSISPDSYIRDKSTGKKYSLLTAQNCALSPRSTPIEKGKTNTFTLIFPALPEGTKKIDFVESEDSTWKFYNIDLQ